MSSERKQTAKKEVKRPGRPSHFSHALAGRICEELSRGVPLEVVCRRENMPPVRTVANWRKLHRGFSADIARAREAGFDALAAECLEIADDTSKDTVETDYGLRPNSEWIARCKIRIDTRLKLLAKWTPKRYGNKLALEVKGKTMLKVVIGGDA